MANHYSQPALLALPQFHSHFQNLFEAGLPHIIVQLVHCCQSVFFIFNFHRLKCQNVCPQYFLFVFNRNTLMVEEIFQHCESVGDIFLNNEVVWGYWLKGPYLPFILLLSLIYLHEG